MFALLACLLFPSLSPPAQVDDRTPESVLAEIRPLLEARDLLLDHVRWTFHVLKSPGVGVPATLWESGTMQTSGDKARLELLRADDESRSVWTWNGVEGASVVRRAQGPPLVTRHESRHFMPLALVHPQCFGTTWLGQPLTDLLYSKHAERIEFVQVGSLRCIAVLLVKRRSSGEVAGLDELVLDPGSLLPVRARIFHELLDEGVEPARILGDQRFELAVEVTLKETFDVSGVQLVREYEVATPGSRFQQAEPSVTRVESAEFGLAFPDSDFLVATVRGAHEKRHATGQYVLTGVRSHEALTREDLDSLLAAMVEGRELELSQDWSEDAEVLDVGCADVSSYVYLGLLGVAARIPEARPSSFDVHARTAGELVKELQEESVADAAVYQLDAGAFRGLRAPSIVLLHDVRLEGATHFVLADPGESGLHVLLPSRRVVDLSWDEYFRTFEPPYTVITRCRNVPAQRVGLGWATATVGVVLGTSVFLSRPKREAR